MDTNLKPVSPDALLSIVEQVKEYYVAPPLKRQRGCPRTFSGRTFLPLAVVAVVLRTFKVQELHTLLSKEPRGRGARSKRWAAKSWGKSSPAPMNPKRRRLMAACMRHKDPAGTPATGRNVDTDSAWSKSGYRGWVQGYCLVLQGLVFPAPVPLFAHWGPNSVGESTVRDQALAAEHFPVTELLLGDSAFGGAALVAAYGRHGGWLLTPQQLPANPEAWQHDLYAYHRETIKLLFQRIIQACDLKACPAKGLAPAGTFVIASVWLYQALFLDNYRHHRPLAHIKDIIDEGRWRIAA